MQAKLNIILTNEANEANEAEISLEKAKEALDISDLMLSENLFTLAVWRDLLRCCNDNVLELGSFTCSQAQCPVTLHGRIMTKKHLNLANSFGKKDGGGLFSIVMEIHQQSRRIIECLLNER